MRHFIAHIAVACGASLLLNLPAPAQNYPMKPVRIMAASAGTSSDIFSRHLALGLSGQWGQTVMVENRPGASAMMPAEIASRAMPDGYTLLMGELGSLASAISLFKIKYDPVKDFAPITLFATAPLVLIAHPSVGPADLRELMAYVKKHPGTINYASGSNGSPGHLTSVLLSQLAGLDMVHVPYKGAGAATLAVVAGHVQITCLNTTVVMHQIKAGRVKAYALFARNRVAALPEVPTATEAGMGGLEAAQWLGVLAPARTPAAIVDKLNRDIIQILNTPALREVMLAQGAEAIPGTPEEFSAFIKSEIAKWKRVITLAGVRVD
jgi:tripartite-type tricarboxylate transporter receptor subunit TctC